MTPAKTSSHQPSLSLAVPLALALAVWGLVPLLDRDRPRPDSPTLRVVTGAADAIVPAITGQSRAIVYIGSPLSTQGVLGHHRFLDAAAQLASRPSQTSARIFVIEDEHRDDTMAWGAALRDPRLEAFGHAGNGWVLWLEHGRLREVDDCAGCPGQSADSLVARTLALWP